MTRASLLALLLILGAAPFQAAEAPAPFGAVPSARQLAWHQLETYAFVHFTVNTFTDREWGYGDESPAVFNPSHFDADQIAASVARAGLRGIVLTCKHHDGFCLWPSRYSEHTIAQSPYRGGKGDLVREISDACRRHGLKFGVYLSPWDRNRGDYGTPAYLEYYRNQLRELLTNYGPVFEVWFDGANGGDGYYGGAREKRTIDPATYYDWPKTWKIVRELQPDAVIFSDAGPDVRWVGNEKGVAGDPGWATINAQGFFPGHADHLDRGDRVGESWMPAEADVSIRPGWFFHESETPRVKTPAALFGIYLTSVGRGTNLILNLAPDRRGMIPAADLDALQGWRRLYDATFGRDLARDAQVSASGTRGQDPRFSPAQVVDGRADTYWSLNDGETTGEIVLQFGQPRVFNLVRLREYLPLGQRIDRVALDRWDEKASQWIEFATATSIGAQRLIPTHSEWTTKLRVRIVQAAACPALSEVALFLAPGDAFTTSRR